MHDRSAQICRFNRGNKGHDIVKLFQRQNNRADGWGQRCVKGRGDVGDLRKRRMGVQREKRFEPDAPILKRAHQGKRRGGTQTLHPVSSTDHVAPPANPVSQSFAGIFIAVKGRLHLCNGRTVSAVKTCTPSI